MSRSKLLSGGMWGNLQTARLPQTTTLSSAGAPQFHINDPKGGANYIQLPVKAFCFPPSNATSPLLVMEWVGRCGKKAHGEGGNSERMTSSGSRVGGERNVAKSQPMGICTYEPLRGPPSVKPASSFPGGARCGPSVGVSPSPFHLLSPLMSK